MGFPYIFLDFLEGELKVVGSMFSESTSSNEGECRRLTGDARVTEAAKNVLTDAFNRQ